MFKWKGIELRLVLALAMLSLTTLFLSIALSFTFNDLNHRLVELKETDIPALETAARLNDMVRIIITTSSQLNSAESNSERDQALTKINATIADMDKTMRQYPEYHSYFKDFVAQVSNSLTLLYQSKVESQQLNLSLRDLLEGFYPLLKQASESLDALPTYSKRQMRYAQLKSLLYYQLGLVEKLYNDFSFNELDYTSYRLEQVGEEWWHLWQASQLQQSYPELAEQLRIIHDLTARSGTLYQLKNKAIDHSYQEQFFLQISRDHLSQLTVQIENNTNTVNSNIDGSISQAQASLISNQRLALFISIFSIIAAVAISWFYVRKNILERLSQLKDNMRAVSIGKLDTEVSISGHDEVTQMAKYLQVFQTTARIVKQTNAQLEAEVIERTQAEAKLRVTQDELIQAGKLAALGQLSVGITHEINQPLTAVNSHVRSAQLWLQQQRSDKALINLAKIETLLGKTAAITSHLKAFARHSDGKLTAVELSPIILDAIELFENKSQKIHIQYLPVSAVSVRANHIRLEQVLVNLISNAIDAVELQANPAIEITVHTNKDAEVEITVSDNGAGILAEDLPHIFDPFYSRKESGKGLGLGLSIAYNIIKDFGGSIHAKSCTDPALGQGTQFIISLQQGS